MNLIILVTVLFIEVLVLIFLSSEKHVDPHIKYETDIRLTYKRFMELYPNSQMSYEAYKTLQSKNAFKTTISSRKIRRMVR